MPSRDGLATVARMRFRRAPLAGAAGAFALGIGLGRAGAGWDWVAPVVLLLAGLALLCVLALVGLRWALRVAVWPVLGVWVVLGMGAYGWRVAPSEAQVAGLADGLSREVRGRVVSMTVPVEVPAAGKDADGVMPWEASEDTSAEKGRSVVVDLALDAVEQVTPEVAKMVPAAGGVRVSVYGVAPAVACGDEVRGALRLREPVRYRDPGVFQVGEYLAGQGMALTSGVAGDNLRVTRVGKTGWECRVRAAQGWASGRMTGFTGSGANRAMPGWLRLSAEDGAMLSAMLFGDRTGLSHSLRRGV